MKNDKKIEILKKYVCLSPFKRVEIFNKEIYPCCISWIKTPIGNINNMENILDEDLLYKVRKSILDGKYKFCDHEKCSVLIDLLHGDRVGDFVRVDSINKEELLNSSKITEVKLNIDQSCNLHCGSCRTSVIMSNREENILIKNKLSDIMDAFGKDLIKLDITGFGDPFASKTYVDFILNFDETKFPNLKEISFFTNGILLNEKMWNKMYKIHKYIKTIQISIDAATKETYEKIRSGGNWEILMSNINFLLTKTPIDNMEYIFIVQDTNYKEMEQFMQLINSLPHKNKRQVFFNKIYNWETYSDEEYKQKKIWDESHPEFNEFLVELSEIADGHGSNTDLLDIIVKFNLKPKKRLL